jgi:hypothetical protein
VALVDSTIPEPAPEVTLPSIDADVVCVGVDECECSADPALLARCSGAADDGRCGVVRVGDDAAVATFS